MRARRWAISALAAASSTRNCAASDSACSAARRAATSSVASRPSSSRSSSARSPAASARAWAAWPRRASRSARVRDLVASARDQCGGGAGPSQSKDEVGDHPGYPLARRAASSSLTALAISPEVGGCTRWGVSAAARAAGSMPPRLSCWMALRAWRARSRASVAATGPQRPRPARPGEVPGAVRGVGGAVAVDRAEFAGERAVPVPHAHPVARAAHPFWWGCADGAVLEVVEGHVEVPISVVGGDGPPGTRQGPGRVCAGAGEGAQLVHDAPEGVDVKVVAGTRVRGRKTAGGSRHPIRRSRGSTTRRVPGRRAPSRSRRRRRSRSATGTA